MTLTRSIVCNNLNLTKIIGCNESKFLLEVNLAIKLLIALLCLQSYPLNVKVLCRTIQKHFWDRFGISQHLVDICKVIPLRPKLMSPAKRVKGFLIWHFPVDLFSECLNYCPGANFQQGPFQNGHKVFNRIIIYI